MPIIQFDRLMEANTMKKSNDSRADVTEIVADGMMTIPEVAEFLRVSKSKLYELMDRGELRFCKMVGSRRIPRREAINYAERCLKGGWRI